MLTTLTRAETDDRRSHRRILAVRDGGNDAAAAAASASVKDGPTGWRAALELRFSARADVNPDVNPDVRPHAPGVSGGDSSPDKRRVRQTVLRHRHVGPLRIQKALYPEGQDCCHAVMIHPPGGIACSDHLCVDVQVEANSHGLILTPAATKWYGAFGSSEQASQTIALDVQGVLEWLPAETIVFDQARVRSLIDMNIGPQGQMFGWDQLIFGRRGCDESFETGMFDQRMQLQFGPERVWIDRMRLCGSDPLFQSPLGFSGCDSCQTAWMVTSASDPVTDDLLDAARQTHPDIAFSRIHPRVLVMRSLASASILRSRFERLWHWVRPRWIRRQPHTPRLWAT
ncbi:urease accessory protein UreD [Orrella marina]|nr:urease accessory protein UreD [Orrella marina]